MASRAGGSLENSKPALAVWITVAFALGACSMAYELLIARALSDLFSHEVLCQSITVGAFLLGMGWGAWRSTRKTSKPDTDLLVQTELLLTLAGVAGPIVLMVGITFLQAVAPALMTMVNENEFATAALVLGLQPITFLIGFLSGWELPLLIRLAGERHTSRLLAASYFGGLVGSWSVLLAMSLHFSPQQASWIVGAGNWIIAFSLIVILWSPMQLRWIVRSVSVWAVIFLLGLAQPVVLSTYLKIEYGGYVLEPLKPVSWNQLAHLMQILTGVQRQVTAFQNLDIVDEVFFSGVGREPEFSLHINRRPQFSAGQHQSYHESMVHGALNLSGTRPTEVFVFGGGDGLVVRELLKLDYVKKIVLVELDPQMIELSKTHEKIREINGGSLTDARVEVVIDDALSYLRQMTVPIEAVFVDFPYPDGFDTAKLFSREFFAILKKRLSASGFAVVDAPIWREIGAKKEVRPLPQDILVSTLNGAGIKSFLLYGPIEPFLFIPGTARDKFAFEYERLPPWLHNKTRVNLTALDDLLQDTQIRNEFVNSIFKPRKWN